MKQSMFVVQWHGPWWIWVPNVCQCGHDVVEYFIIYVVDTSQFLLVVTYPMLKCCGEYHNVVYHALR